MDLQISGKKALVMSSSRGLGAGIAFYLAQEGVDVLLTGRDENNLEAVTFKINSQNFGKASYVVADLAANESVNILIDAVAAKLGGADIFIGNTGGPPPGRMIDADTSKLSTYFEVMVTRIAKLAATLSVEMKSNCWGRILTIGSSGVVQPIPNLAISNMIRSALVGWSKSLSNDLAAEGITVNMLIPGRIHTKRIDELDQAVAKRSDRSVEDVRIESRKTIPVGRYGAVDEFAATAAFLCSGPAAYITGTVIRCDGGMIKAV